MTAHDGGRLLFHFFHIVPRAGGRSYPDTRTVGFRRDRADPKSFTSIATLEKDLP